MRAALHRISVVAAVAAVIGGAGCDRAEAARSRLRIVHVVEGFQQPESAIYDPRQDVFFVSNIVGFGSEKDGLAYIARFDAGDPLRIEIFIESGRNGVTLHAPKGMTIQADTLWVADIDVMRGFDRLSGAPVAQVDLAPYGAVLLNSATVGDDGILYVTDSGILMTRAGILFPGGDKIFAIRGGAVSVIAEGATLLHPNGIRWDSERRRLIVAGFHPFGSEAYALAPDGGSRTVIASGPGRFDGVEVLPGGGILLTSWSDSSLYRIGPGGAERVIRDLWQPADLGFDSRRGRVAIPLVLQGKVELWELPDE